MVIPRMKIWLVGCVVLIDVAFFPREVAARTADALLWRRIESFDVKNYPH
jgi:hypothetical protein